MIKGQEIITNIEELDKCINKIEKIFSSKDLLEIDFGKAKINSYYSKSSFGYKYLHSENGAVHMALNYDGIFNEKGYLAQAKEISELIKDNNCNNILELGCGKGFNSSFLAKEFPKKNFHGIDITHKHLSIANQNAQGLDNLYFSYGDFHDLEFKESTFDLIFELESICHAFDQKIVLESVYKTLKSKGLFVLYEGFRMNNFDNLSDNLIKASRLTEKSMAVNSFFEIDKWLKIAADVGFNIRICEDISEAIMPNLGRFQRLARGYFKYPFLAKIFLFLLPREMVMNSIAGLLMPFTIFNKAQGYYKIILEKV